MYPHVVTSVDSDGDLLNKDQTYMVRVNWPGEPVYKVQIWSLAEDGIRGSYSIHGSDMPLGLFLWSDIEQIDKA